jgi:hypothetical protein
LNIRDLGEISKGLRAEDLAADGESKAVAVPYPANRIAHSERRKPDPMLFVAIGTLLIALSVALLVWSLPKVPAHRD